MNKSLLASKEYFRDVHDPHVQRSAYPLLEIVVLTYPTDFELIRQPSPPIFSQKGEI